MIEIIITINTLAFIAAIVYIQKKASDEKTEIIREFTKAFLSKDIEEYANTIPDDATETEQKEEDEIQDVDSVDERLLIKHLKEQNGDNKS